MASIQTAYPDRMLITEFIGEGGMTVRLCNALRTEAWTNGGFKTVGDLRRADDKTLLRIKNLGKTSIRELRDLVGHSPKPVAASKPAGPAIYRGYLARYADQITAWRNEGMCVKKIAEVLYDGGVRPPYSPYSLDRQACINSFAGLIYHITNPKQVAARQHVEFRHDLAPWRRRDALAA